MHNKQEPIFAEDLENPATLFGKIFKRAFETISHPSIPTLWKAFGGAFGSTFELFKTGVENASDLWSSSGAIDRVKLSRTELGIQKPQQTIKSETLASKLKKINAIDTNNTTPPTKKFAIISNDMSDDIANPVLVAATNNHKIEDDLSKIREQLTK
jgi:hypothetical protein